MASDRALVDVADKYLTNSEVLILKLNLKAMCETYTNVIHMLVGDDPYLKYDNPKIITHILLLNASEGKLFTCNTKTIISHMLENNEVTRIGTYLDKMVWKTNRPK